MTRGTVGCGAVIERSLVQRHIRRLLRTIPHQLTGQRRMGYLDALIDLRIWLQMQPTRTTRPGGIGR